MIADVRSPRRPFGNALRHVCAGDAVMNALLPICAGRWCASVWCGARRRGVSCGRVAVRLTATSLNEASGVCLIGLLVTDPPTERVVRPAERWLMTSAMPRKKKNSRGTEKKKALKLSDIAVRWRWRRRRGVVGVLVGRRRRVVRIVERQLDWYGVLERVCGRAEVRDHEAWQLASWQTRGGTATVWLDSLRRGRRAAVRRP